MPAPMSASPSLPRALLPSVTNGEGIRCRSPARLAPRSIWLRSPPPTPAVTALVVTNAAGSATSATATLTVTQTAVIVSITSPTNGATFTAPATFPLTASATPAASITRVDFFQGSTLLGSLNAAPYTFNVINLGAGNYTYTARAVSSSGHHDLSPGEHYCDRAAPPAPARQWSPSLPLTPMPPKRDRIRAPSRWRAPGPRPMPLTVYYLLGGTAVNGQDYQMIPTNVTIAASSATAEHHDHAHPGHGRAWGNQ